ncbi:phage major capsid protein, P2 family [Marinomonas aquiplantarum]|uniref:P2 family phage major capsid protein n=1 Tax=Marinomonas aquiplantarum TaxID=491951 RepID=A0A366D031_9GAMM|nr:phage major capsid protein, P2 family [Marinomonas aquiplantarum]RBO83427.1 P2 family phage major capsid protein [Marinomonas aquiplantarum]
MAKTLLSPQGKTRLKAYLNQVYAAVNAAVGEEFEVEPSVQQRLYEKAAEHGAWFLKLINVETVAQIKGEKVGLAVSGLLTKRTNTDSNDRKTSSVVSESKSGYECQFTEVDVHITYSKLDKWRNRTPQQYAELYSSIYRKAMTDDRIRIGWHGTSIAAETDPEKNPNGEDVNKGWIQKVRDEAAEQIDEDGLTFGHMDADMRNLDVVVESAKQMIPEHLRDDSQLMAFVSSDLMADYRLNSLAANGDQASEKVLVNDNKVMAVFAGLKAVTPPFFPSGTVIVTYPENLSIYLQEGSLRRHIKDNPTRSRVEDYNSENVDYIVEEPEAIGIITNVTQYEEAEAEAE